MTQGTDQKSKNNVIIIGIIALTLLLGGFGYLYYAIIKPPLIYTTTVGMSQTYKLKPRPIRRRPNPLIKFYISGEVVNISQYQQIEIINTANIGLRLLEELDEKGLMLEIEPLPKNAEKRINIRYEEPPILMKEAKAKDGSQVYTIEVEKLKKGKKYIICEDIPWENHPFRYFLALANQPPPPTSQGQSPN